MATVPAMDQAVVGRLLKPDQFKRVLAAPWRITSPHFVMHFLPASAAGRVFPRQQAAENHPADSAVPGFSSDLSTDLTTAQAAHVDELGVSLGLVIPKRHAKRAVTRNLFKRQIRAEVQRCEHQLPAGWWVVRLRAPFDRQAFVSAQSEALRRAAGQELAQLIERGAQRAQAGAR
jgi:ribonuclease P protein component